MWSFTKKTTTTFSMNEKPDNKQGKDNTEDSKAAPPEEDDPFAALDKGRKASEELTANLKKDKQEARQEETTQEQKPEPAQEQEQVSEPEQNNPALEALQTQLADKEEALLRAQADAANARRIKDTEIEKNRKYGTEKIAKDLIDLADTFDRAAECLPDNLDDKPELKAMAEGITMMRGMLSDIFERHNIKQMDIKPGETAFDPNYHNALSQIPATGSIKPNSVADIHRPGYMLHDRVLRAADVLVAKP